MVLFQEHTKAESDCCETSERLLIEIHDAAILFLEGLEAHLQQRTNSASAQRKELEAKIKRWLHTYANNFRTHYPLEEILAQAQREHDEKKNHESLFHNIVKSCATELILELRTRIETITKMTEECDADHF